MAKVNIINYIDKKSFIHDLKGSTKLLILIFFSLAAMITYDTRFLIFLSIIGLISFKISKIKFKEIKIIGLFLFVFLFLNLVLIYLFAPNQGTLIYGTKTIIFNGFWRFYLTQEELFYLLNVLLKYMAVIPIAVLFIVTTYPSEFASSLNGIKVPYRISYAVSIALRYVPTLQDDFSIISKSQQARGVDMSKNVKLSKRFKNLTSTLIPLIFSSMDRIDVISNALVLRGFGKNKKRTWFHDKKTNKIDYILILISFSLILVSLVLQNINNGRFYNPF